MIKICNSCFAEKDNSEFFANKGMPDGKLKQCKTCTKKVNNERYKRNNKKYIAQQKLHNQKPEVKKRQSLYCKMRRSKDPEKFRARNAVNNALRYGKIKKEPCYHCGSDRRLEAHHKDYSKPLDIVWVCQPCHRVKEHGGTYSLT